MRTLALVALAVVLAGCAQPGTPPASPYPVHHEDCLRVPEARPCLRATEASPLEVAGVASENASRWALTARNVGSHDLHLRGDPPVLWIYVLRDEGIRRAAVVDEGARDGPRALPPGGDATWELHYGVDEDGRQVVRYGRPHEPAPWPPYAYRLCMEARVPDTAGWSRGCIDADARAAAKGP